MGVACEASAGVTPEQGSKLHHFLSWQAEEAFMPGGIQGDGML